MKIRQNVRHVAAMKALELPVLGEKVHDWLVSLHVRVFAKKADPDHREERRAHLKGLFDALMDAYLTALRRGYSEAEAREIVHLAANFDFYNHGWTEMMEFPVDEVDAHYDRYRAFFSDHAILVSDPLGRFVPPGGIPDAPATAEKLDEPDQPNAEGGYADDVYVEDEAGEVHRGGRDDGEMPEVDDADLARHVGGDGEN